MAQRFRMALLFFSVFISCATFCQAAQEDISVKPEHEQNSEALQIISQRMRSLTQSLGAMPEPPALNQTIHLPEALAQLPQKKKSQS